MVFCSDNTIAIGERLKPPAASSSDDAARQPALPARVDVAVVGAGVIGLSIAWRLVRRGLSVAVFERAQSGTGTSLAATGMLAASAEHEPGGDELLALALESQRQWPQFRAELEAEIPVFRSTIAPRARWWWRSAATRSNGCAFASNTSSAPASTPAG